MARKLKKIELGNIVFRYPEYYKVITEPIDLKIIAGKIVDNKYEDLTQLEDDIGQMCKNAQMFNEPGSQIYRDARVIMKTVKQKKFELEAARVARENRGSRSRSRAPIKKRYATDVSLLLDFQQVLDRKILCNKETIKSRTSDLRLFGLTLTLTFEVLLKKVF